MKRKLSAVVVLVALTLACASLESNAYKTLGTTAAAVDAAMKAYGSLVAAGKVPAATQATVKTDYEHYQQAMLAAQAAIALWHQVGGASSAFPSDKVNLAVAAAGAVQLSAGAK